MKSKDSCIGSWDAAVDVGLPSKYCLTESAIAFANKGGTALPI